MSKPSVAVCPDPSNIELPEGIKFIVNTSHELTKCNLCLKPVAVLSCKKLGGTAPRAGLWLCNHLMGDTPLMS